ncbi:LPS translocon maturation chaperone LptM [Novosphingobium sp. B 225]|uniref:LPS translocon maturation chaperone LptM n=1 Tax=Novosphingobium sp. B 225 TaxID=1961849 RepID=UPI000B4B8206|nr:lipoprotein [Novosphingobium sp. B 225]
MRRLFLAAAILALAACGQKADLKPRPGKQLPPAPYGREDQPSADDLTKVTVQSAPERSVELRKRSEERADDPFDLPPS